MSDVMYDEPTPEDDESEFIAEALAELEFEPDWDNMPGGHDYENDRRAEEAATDDRE